MPEVTDTSALALIAGSDQKQLAVQAKKYAFADYALNVCGLVRPCSQHAQTQQSIDSNVESSSILEMRDVVNIRGVEQRLEDDFGLKRGQGEDVPVKESLDAFMHRTIVQLRREDVNDVIKLFDRVEKNNRKAVVTDAAFREQRAYFAAKVAADDAEELAEDIEHGTLHRGSAEEYAEFADWCEQFESRDARGDAFLNSDTRGEKLMRDDGTFAGHDLVKIRDALHYFECNSQSANVETISIETVESTRPDAKAIEADLAKWNPVAVVSAYRRLSLVKHPDKEGGSPESFQELTEHARILTEACAKFHGVTVNKKHTARRNDGGSGARGPAKVAICAHLPEELKLAVAFFGFTEESFRCSSPAEIKKVRQLLSVLKDRKEKYVQSQKKPDKLVDMLHEAGPASPGGNDAEDFGEKSLKQLKTLCVNLCRVHYASVYGHIQKLK